VQPGYRARPVPLGRRGRRGERGPAGPQGSQGEKGEPALIASNVKQDATLRSISSGFIDLCNVQVTAGGDPILVGGNITVAHPAADFDLSVYRDGIQISSGYRDSSVTTYDVPSAGLHTYQLRLSAFGPITVMGCKAFALAFNQ
jgi:hypothetical protein